MEHCNMVCSHIVPESKLARDENGYGTAVDATKYKKMVGSLMHFIYTRCDLTFSMFLIAIYLYID